MEKLDQLEKSKKEEKVEKEEEGEKGDFNNLVKSIILTSKVQLPNEKIKAENIMDLEQSNIL